ncbi:hypothetical protein C8J57DRAFT_1287137 [Mycena rebaudengoi]|nr:hypothetical protein C8J57DRAFT_1287137 [Mycena rebaudengoi]
MSLDMDQDSDSWDLIQYYAAPITQDGLSFNGREVYVQTESRHRVARADASRLHSLLTYTTPPPVLTKAGKVAKRQPPPHKDETEEFYVAQLMHYGLKPLKTKEAAKKALLAAFGPGNTLEVPPRILELKEKMRKEYSEANKIAKAKYLEDQKQEKLKEEEKRKKRKRETDAILENFTAQANKKGKTNAKLPQNTEFSGKFDIIAPYLTEQWEDQTRDSMWLKLCLSSTSSHLWGSFDFGVVTGVIRSSGPLPTTVGGSVSFFWRGRETGEGEATFGDGNIGTITFLGGGNFKAHMDWTWGRLKALRKWKAQWRGINERAYNRENIERWGKWGGDGDDAEQPAGSDTSEGAESRSDEEHEAEEYEGSDDDMRYSRNLAF